MTKFKDLLKSTLYFIGIIIISTIFITIIDYFSLFNTSIIKLIVPILSIFISSYILGIKTIKLGYLSGIKLSSIIIILFLSLILILDKFNIKTLLYYLILILTSILGSMIGKLKNKSLKQSSNFYFLYLISLIHNFYSYQI